MSLPAVLLIINDSPSMIASVSVLVRATHSPVQGQVNSYRSKVVLNLFKSFLNTFKATRLTAEPSQ
jgi:hypothetical protein